MTKPDDGGSWHPDPSGCDIPSPGVSTRLVLAAQFAAAWLPIVREHYKGEVFMVLGERANTFGLAMADDLLRRLKGE